MNSKIVLILVILSYSTYLGAQCVDPDASIWQHTWQSCEATENPNPDRGTSHWIMYDFGAPYTLGKTRVWNTNEAGKTEMGFKNVTVDYSLDGETWIELGAFEFAQGTGEAIYEGFESFDFDSIQAQYVIITAVDNWGHDDCFGIAEIKFNIAPLPYVPEDLYEEECYAPDNATAFVLTPEEVFILWEMEAFDYFLFNYRPLGGEWTTITTEEPELFLEELTPGETYEYQIEVICNEEESIQSDLFEFTLIEEQEACGPPLVSNWIIFDEEFVIISWNEVPDAEGYRFQYRAQGADGNWIAITPEENFVEIEGLEEESIYEYQISVLCPDGWTDYSGTFLFDTAEDIDTGTDDINGKNLSFTVFPNPSKGQVQLKINSPETEKVDIIIRNVMGQNVYYEQQLLNAGTQYHPLSLSRLSAGLYFIAVNSESGGQQTQRLVIVSD